MSSSNLSLFDLAASMILKLRCEFSSPAAETAASESFNGCKYKHDSGCGTRANSDNLNSYGIKRFIDFKPKGKDMDVYTVLGCEH